MSHLCGEQMDTMDMFTRANVKSEIKPPSAGLLHFRNDYIVRIGLREHQVWGLLGWRKFGAKK